MVEGFDLTTESGQVSFQDEWVVQDACSPVVPGGEAEELWQGVRPQGAQQVGDAEETPGEGKPAVLNSP